MDNTFCHPSFDFPSRVNERNLYIMFNFAFEKPLKSLSHNFFNIQEISEKMLLSLVADYKDTHEIVIGLDSLGKERLLVAIAKQFNVRVS